MTNEELDILRIVEDRIEELKKVKQALVKCKRDYECLMTELNLVRKQNDRLMTSLKDCANELCRVCGKHINDHLGSCDSCKWKDVKYWDVE